MNRKEGAVQEYTKNSAFLIYMHRSLNKMQISFEVTASPGQLDHSLQLPLIKVRHF